MAAGKLEFERSKCEPTHFFGPTIRDFYVLHFLVSGKGEYQVRGRTIPLKKGDCFLVIPNEPIFYRADPEDLGFQNFSELFSDPIFLNSFGTMFKIMLPKLAIGVIMPLVGAELIFAVRKTSWQSAYRFLFLLPMVAPGVVNLLIWKNIYDANSGLMTELVRLLGIVGPEESVDWLGSSKYIIFSIIFMGFPWLGGTSVLIYMSGLMNISTEVIEASRLDGAGTWTRIFRIDLPLLMGQIRYFLIFGLIGGFQDYGVQVVLTSGGPDGYATYVPGYYMYELMYAHGTIGKAAAVGTVLFLIIMVVTAVTYKFVNRREEF